VLMMTGITTRAPAGGSARGRPADRGSRRRGRAGGPRSTGSRRGSPNLTLGQAGRRPRDACLGEFGRLSIGVLYCSLDAPRSPGRAGQTRRDRCQASPFLRRSVDVRGRIGASIVLPGMVAAGVSRCTQRGHAWRPSSLGPSLARTHELRFQMPARLRDRIGPDGPGWLPGMTPREAGSTIRQIADGTAGAVVVYDMDGGNRRAAQHRVPGAAARPGGRAQARNEISRPS